MDKLEAPPVYPFDVKISHSRQIWLKHFGNGKGYQW